MRSKAPLLLMEQLIMVLVFALAAAVCVQAFVLSDRISRRSAARDQAVIAAESMAEQWKACGGDAAKAAAAYGGSVEQGLWTKNYDGGEVSLLGGTDEGGLRTASVDAVAAGDTEAVYSLTVACQAEAES